ncbi:MAG: hypothetical protein ABI577_11090 [bacterium]
MPTRDATTGSNWVVELATGRVMNRQEKRPCVRVDPSRTLDGGRKEGEVGRMTDEKAREQARKDLNPIEDIKGAIRYIKELDPVEEVKEFMETAAEILDPHQSDVRVIEPEEDSHSSSAEKR